MNTRRAIVLNVGLILVVAASAGTTGGEVFPAAPRRVTFEHKPDAVEIILDGRAVASYVFRDDAVHRPFFAHVKTPSGVQVTRNHPPVKGKDPEDHAFMHPGFWMAFADLGGRDFWRNKGPRVVQERNVGLEDAPVFEVRNKYLDGENVLCRETVNFMVLPRPVGYLLIWDSTLEPQIDGLWMGDVEEMGLGVRVATPMAVKSGNGGKITNSAGGVNEVGTWGKPADWCDYSATLDGKHVGVTIMADPANPRKPWFHSRDYGLMVANSFGERAGAPKRTPLDKGKPVRFRFGVLVHETKEPAAVDLPAEFAAFANFLDPR
jgi:hypothetical protein